MKVVSVTRFAVVSSLSFATTHAFAVSRTTAARSTSRLSVSIGLGPEKQDDVPQSKKSEKVILVAGVDYEVPDHDSYRTSRRSTIDERSDAWFHSLLRSEGGTENDETPPFLGEIAMAARSKLLTPVELKNEVRCIYIVQLSQQSMSLDLVPHIPILHFIPAACCLLIYATMD